MSFKLWATSYKLQATIFEITSCKLRDTRNKITYALADDSTITALHRSMIVLCRPAPYMDRTQLIIRHFHWLMIVSCKCCTILSSARVGGFLNWSYGNIFCRKKWLGPVDFNLKQFYSLSEQIVWVYSFFLPPYMEADSTFKGPNQGWSWLRRYLRGGLTELGICLHSQGWTGAG
jgi:hypothetical protein